MWVVIKFVDNRIVGCVVGVFDSEADAERYGEAVAKYSLGYEKWVVRELQLAKVVDVDGNPTLSPASENS